MPSSNSNSSSSSSSKNADAASGEEGEGRRGVTSLERCCCSLLEDRACSSSEVREGRGTAMALQVNRRAVVVAGGGGGGIEEGGKDEVVEVEFFSF